MNKQEIIDHIRLISAYPFYRSPDDKSCIGEVFEIPEKEDLMDMDEEELKIWHERVKGIEKDYY